MDTDAGTDGGAVRVRGCGCGASSGGPLVLVALLLLGRRRRLGWAAAVAVFLGAACQETPAPTERAFGTSSSALCSDFDASLCTPAQVLLDPHNCGRCGTVCSYVHAGGLCVDGGCVMGACEYGWSDLDASAPGCEYGCIPRSPPVELCNGRDDDCNGLVDEGFDLTSDPLNCGACANVCALPHASARCASSSCVVNGCDAGFADLDDAGFNGCEYACPVNPPVAERCNGLDDDCNGLIDDSPVDAKGSCATQCPAPAACVAAGTCSAPLASCDAGCCGACRPGTWVCQGARTCTGGVGPGAEVCDGLDDNCDGQIDEGFGAPLYNVDPRNCGSCGTVCALPHGVNGCHSDLSIDPTGHGVCYVVACSDGYGYAPTSPCGTTPLRDGPSGVGCNLACPVWPKAPETCNGKDDDCNGQVDELRSLCFPAGLVPPSGLCSQQGVCLGQLIPVQCGGAGGWRCNYSGVPNADTDLAGNLRVNEARCDGLDNNCNGTVDLDGFPTKGQACQAGKGVCANAGTMVCSGTSAVACSATATPTRAVDELCNGKDDNCDGQVDERTPLGTPTCYNGGAHACTGYKDPMVRVPVGLSAVYVAAYEASRPDSSPTGAGALSTRACATSGVVPWTGLTQAQAAAACAAVKDSAGTPMRLCTQAEWQAACEGPGGAAAAKWSQATTPGTYVAQVCNDANHSAAPAVWVTGTVGTSGSCFTDWVAAGKLWDLSGNVREWTSTTTLSGGNTYASLGGGGASSLPTATTCEFTGELVRTSGTALDRGFRCCAANAP